LPLCFLFYQRVGIPAAAIAQDELAHLKVDRLTSVGMLITNADDFGLTGGVNRAVVELHRAGLLTSTTLMSSAGATQQAAELARQMPQLGVGCHVVLVDGDPVLSPVDQIPHLAESSSGRFRSTLGKFLPWLHGLSAGSGTAEQRAREIEAETSAQVALLQQQGVPLTHIDTHKHTHMFPAVLRPVLRAASRAGIRVVRNPFEPSWSVAATPRAPWLRRFQVNTLRRLEQQFRRIVAEEGFRTTDGALGVLATGTLDPSTVRSLLQSLPSEGIYELVTHPGYNDADLQRAHTRLLASRELESKSLSVLKEHAEIRLTSFAHLG